MAPLVPLRDVVIYPHMVLPLFVGREKSIDALEAAMQADKQVVLLAQRQPELEEPTQEEMYGIGALANILQLLKLPDGTVKVLVEGVERVSVKDIESKDYLIANYEVIDSVAPENEVETGVMVSSMLAIFDQYVKQNKKVPAEVVNAVTSIEEPGRLADTVAAHLGVKLEQKQSVLEMLDAGLRLEVVMGMLEGELELLQIEKRIRGRVRQQMEKSQREYYLNEQMKAIQKELGELDDVPNEVQELTAKIEASGMPKDVRTKADAELSKLKMMSPMSAEASVVRNYIEWLTSVPWQKKTRVRHDLAKAEAILDADHDGLEKVKDRILDYLAVQKRVRKLKGPILCLVGPPGVGKTSLGQSIAKATNREYVRMALGGVRDEAEIRGHRRTYIGAMPGKIVQNLAKAKVKNPLFLLDEIDKMAQDFRGDPASALLEVLDPEQNSAFGDHYLEVDADLSDIMFVATSNSMNIPPALLDRMEVIRLAGYTEEEKLAIASNHLLPKQMKNHGVKDGELSVSEGAIREIIRHYTREAGVRSLERELSKLCRKVVREFVSGERDAGKKIVIQAGRLDKYLGVQRFDFGKAEEDNRVGQVTGLAWTEVGGELLTIEAATMQGKGRLTYTGQLGDVMQESIQAAMTVVRGRAGSYGLAADFNATKDIHIHVPEGATPKDGPSAGIAMCTALVSALTDIPVRSNVAMTGEITLRGEVLPIGGLKEKLLAAHRGGITKALIPKDNVKDLAEIPDNIKGKLEIVPVQWIDEVLHAALAEMPEPLSEIAENSLQSNLSDGSNSTSNRAH